MLRVIDKQNHPNIIGIIAFYSWRGEVNFVFPFVERNLHTVLHKDWKPENIARIKNGGFPNNWLWLQMLKVADALRTIHDPPIQIWPERGKIVGFHFDLKPGNILVKNDGTLLITDFGQSMIKLVQENDLAYGDYTGGDYGYQPPEVCPRRDTWNDVTRSVFSADIQSSVLPPSPPAAPYTPPATGRSFPATSPPYTPRDRGDSMTEPTQSLPMISRDNTLPASNTEAETTLVGSSMTSYVSRITATTNYDVWSLACIMLEVLVFILKGGSKGIIVFEQERKNEGRDLSFHDGRGRNANLKTCVMNTLNSFRDLDLSNPPAQQISAQHRSYLTESINLLYGMFNPDPAHRKSSDQVVNEFEEIRKNYPEVDSPETDLVRYIKSCPCPPGFTEVGWPSLDSSRKIKPFYHMYVVPFYLQYETYSFSLNAANSAVLGSMLRNVNRDDVMYEIESPDIQAAPRTVVGAKLQIYYKRDAFYIKIAYGTSHGPVYVPYTSKSFNPSL